MSYIGRYERLIQKARTQNLSSDYEVHHILPKSLGGTDSKENLVKMTYRQHYVAHLILWKIHGGKMANAFFFMNQQLRYKKIGSKAYQKLREQASNYISKVNSGRRLGVNRINEMREITRKQMQNPEAIKNLREKRFAQIITKESYQKQAKTMASLVWMNNGVRSFRIKPELVEQKLANGLVFGRLCNFIDGSFKEKRKRIALKQWAAVKASGHSGHLISI
jgi:hypothetical protein